MGLDFDRLADLRSLRDDPGMESLCAHTEVAIRGTHNAWSVVPPESGEGRRCRMDLEIQGDGKNGVHLVMSPAGFFTADSWHASRDEAIEDARETFGVRRDAWRPCRPK